MAVPESTTFKWADVATVTLLVGEAKAVFNVHEVILFEASPFFKDAFASNFREGSERTMTLPEDDKSVFEHFVNWLYHRRYYIRILRREDSDEEVDDVYMQYVKFLLLADKYRVPDLCSHVLSQLFLLLKASFLPTINTIAYAYEHTSQDAAIRKVFADHLACNFESDVFDSINFQNCLRAQPDIAVDMAFSLSEHAVDIENPFNGEMPMDYKEESSENKN